MKKLYHSLRKYVFSLALLLTTLVNVGCMAVNYPEAVQSVDPATTIRGMQAAVNGQAGTYILQQGKNLVMGWPAGTQYSWVAFSQDGQLVDMLKTLCGNKACPQAAGDIYNALVQEGWKDLPAGAISPAIVSTVRQLAYLLSIGASLPIVPVLIMPITINPMEILNPEVKG